MQIDYTRKLSEIIAGLSRMVRTDVLMSFVPCDEYGKISPDGYTEDTHGELKEPFHYVCGSLIGFSARNPINEETNEPAEGISVELYFEGIKDIWRCESTPNSPNQFKISQLSNGTRF